MRVVIIDDEVPALRELRFLLEKYEDIEVVGEGYDGEDLEGLVEALKPDAVFLDIHMANLDGVAAAFRFLRRKEPLFLYLQRAMMNMRFKPLKQMQWTIY
ncbi:Response regulator receiver domain-containing protein [Geosporobacter subterraneus DSM 17957]|uniref:Stage 0 sporulation protein A homolog n=1 Tax=Geosporobacter subterraneus DSM 17957 TaxID=1121919 RepID=A0A1M6IGH3_9FIRM|nr:response regulator [Geosporobacter subterraneus]SHJ33466.1 Response regulator receiver domain-containing protein [Geosporobacter subterraneus DSM 17957]